MPHIKALYVSRLCSEKMLKYIFDTAIKKPSQSAQKFHKLLAEGLAMHTDDCRVETLTALPVVPSTHKKRIWWPPSETENKVKYNYVPVINLYLIKDIIVFIYSFVYIFIKNCLRNKQVVICDVLNLTISAGGILACKLTNTRSIGIITDAHELMVGAQPTLKTRLFNKLVSYLISKFDGYVVLTEYMNKSINSDNKPFMIMEGLVDINMTISDNLLINKSAERILIYSGAIYERYGIKKLIEAFLKLEGDDLRLHIYGSGKMEDDMPYYSQLDSRIQYYGMVLNEAVVKKQLEATLLINPRPSDEELTKFSFPSKNMEYMASGTPIVTTLLPGIPDDHFDYIYVFTDESTDGISSFLKALLTKDRKELHRFGEKSKQFVLEQKNNFVQAGKLLKLINEII